MNEKEKIIVTGSAGFIGMHLSERLLNLGYNVLGIDNLNDYYDPCLKKNRLNLLKLKKNFSFEKIDISELDNLDKVFKKFKPDKIVNLAAQAGVRYSIENPHAYISSNIQGFMNILECSKNHNVKGVIYASSSSVYGANKKLPFSVFDSVSKPMSIYAATKRANELMAHSYSSLYNLHTTGLRFFTVYGPWGRPDMAVYIFADKIMKNKTISVFNHGKMKRDFTYIDDIVDGILESINRNYFCEIFNLGNSKSENLLEVIHYIENCLGSKANIEYLDIQPGDVKNTSADILYSNEKILFSPKTSIDVGIPKFIKWFKSYYKIKV